MKQDITKSLSILVLLLFALAVQAQGRFDWAKSYKGVSTSEGQTNRNTVIDSDVDSEGNLYILGEFTYGAQINGTDLLPMTPYGPNWKTVNVVIAKLSPAGELLWHKAIHSNKDNPSAGAGIQVVGDTSVICMVAVVRPNDEDGNYTYFLDTLVTEPDDSIFPADSIIIGHRFLTYLEFGLDGELKEKRFLTAAGIYADGSFTMYDSTHYNDYTCGCDAFGIDSDGNIIIVTQLGVGPYLFMDSIYYGYRILIDGGVRHFDVPVPPNTPNTNRQLLKFSPHFNSLLHHQVLFEPNMGYCQTSVHTNSLMVDEDNAIYLLVNIQHPNLDAIDFNIVGLPDGQLLTCRSTRYGFQVKYDSLLNPVRLFQLDYEDNNSNGNKIYEIPVQSMDEKGEVYVLGEIWAVGNEVYYADTFCLDVAPAVFFARMEGETGEVLSVGEARSSDLTDIGDDRYDHRDMVTKNNRVMAQLSYKNDIHVGDSIITAARPNAYFAGLYIWDKEGHELQFIDYSSCGGTTIDYNSPRGAVLHDSILYLTGRLNGGGTFGDHTIPTGDRAFMVKYVDPAFATPYHHAGITDTADPLTLRAYPNPTGGDLFLDLPDEPITAIALYSATGQPMRVCLTGNRLSLAACPAGVYLLQITTDSNQYQTKIIKL